VPRKSGDFRYTWFWPRWECLLMTLLPSRWFVRPWWFAAVSLVVLAVACLWLTSQPAVHAVPADEPAAAPTRVPWKTSRLVGSPAPPPPFVAARVFPNATFQHPLLLASAPGLDRLFVGEQDGVLYSLARKADAKPELVFDLRKELTTRLPRPKSARFEALY